MCKLMKMGGGVGVIISLSPRSTRTNATRLKYTLSIVAENANVLRLLNIFNAFYGLNHCDGEM